MPKVHSFQNILNIFTFTVLISREKTLWLFQIIKLLNFPTDRRMWWRETNSKFQFGIGMVALASGRWFDTRQRLVSSTYSKRLSLLYITQSPTGQYAISIRNKPLPLQLEAIIEADCQIASTTARPHVVEWSIRSHWPSATSHICSDLHIKYGHFQ